MNFLQRFSVLIIKGYFGTEQKGMMSISRKTIYARKRLYAESLSLFMTKPATE